MRADRLLSLLMLLQTRGRMTAQALADELEVSVRTVYRDLEALSSAGVPVYTDPGPGGGCALVDNYRTHLTGLRETEVQALFMASMPAALADLGFGAELKTALLKLLAALPAERQQDEQWVRSRVYLDWEAGAATEPALHVIRRAVWEDRQLQITYRRVSSFYRREFTRLVNPYGLVAKDSEWHLMCADADSGGEGSDCQDGDGSGGRLRVFRVAELAAAKTTGHTFSRPEGFDLQSVWQTWCSNTQRRKAEFMVTARVSPQCYLDLSLYLAGHFQEADGAGPGRMGAGRQDEWPLLTLYFDSFEGARTKLLGLGAGVEVVTPIALRHSLSDFAEQVVKRYSHH